MLDHSRILAALDQMFPADSAHPERFGVALVAQYADPGLALPTGRSHVFIPDCHLLSPPDVLAYKNNHFRLEAELLVLLEGLAKLKNVHRGDLQVWQLGDLFDIWRARGGRGDSAEVDAICAAFPKHVELLRSSPPTGMRARILAGNHDYMTHELPTWATQRAGFIENQAPGGDILVVHGDAFDWIESLPDKFQACIVRMAKQVTAGQHELLTDKRDVVAQVNQALPAGDCPIGAEQSTVAAKRPKAGQGPKVAVNTVPAPPAGAPKPTTFWKPATKLALELKKHGWDIRLVVIGHTHQPRIVHGNRGDGKPFVLMDCGAWMGQCRLARTDPWVWSAQIGVLSEGEMRIYQLGWRER